MDHSIFIVKGYDDDIQENFEHEESSLNAVTEIYKTLIKDTTIQNLHIYEYNTTTKEYHFVK